MGSVQTFRKAEEWERDRCPFCMEKLGKMEIVQRRLNKKYRCKNCGRIIDERAIHF